MKRLSSAKFIARGTRALWGSALFALGLLLFLITQMPRTGHAQGPSTGSPSMDGIFISEILASNVSTNLTPDYATFSDWIEIHNARDRAVDLGGLYLTDDLNDPYRWEIPTGTWIEPAGFRLFWADGKDRGDHTNFGLNKSRGQVGLFAANRVLIDAVPYRSQLDDISFGRQAGKESNLVYFGDPSPGATNSAPGLSRKRVAPSPKFSLSSGLYGKDTSLALGTTAPSAIVRYTLDGSIPSNTSPVYTSPLRLVTTTVVSARSFQVDRLPGPVVAHTYLVDEHLTLPAVSIVTAPSNLWDLETGIYVDINLLQRKEWERSAVIEFFETDGTLGFKSNVDIRLFGLTAIELPQKSFAVFATDTDGVRQIRYRLFPDKPIERFDSFILRSSSDDWYRTMFLDAMAQEVLETHLDLDTQSYRPVILFLNGAYFGIYNIRDKINQHYIASHHDQDPYNIDLLYIAHSPDKPQVLALNGDTEHYEAMLDYIKNNDVSSPDSYAYIQTQMDVDNFIDYVISEIYVGNTSWYRNRKAWRPRTDSGRWRFMVYDLDRGFGDPNVDTLENMTSYDMLLESLLKNPEFKQAFTQRFAALINTAFHPNGMIDTIDRFQAGIMPEMPGHIARWKDECNASVCGIPSLSEWEANVEALREFVRQRPGYIRQQIVDTLRLGGTAQLKLDRVGQGRILVNQVVVPEDQTTGVYFRDVPLQLEAIPDAGHRFVGWQGIEADAGTVSVALTKDTTVTAVFERVEQPDAVHGRCGSAGILALFLAAGLIGLARQGWFKSAPPPKAGQ